MMNTNIQNTINKRYLTFESSLHFAFKNGLDLVALHTQDLQFLLTINNPNTLLKNQTNLQDCQRSHFSNLKEGGRRKEGEEGGARSQFKAHSFNLFNNLKHVLIM